MDEGRSVVLYDSRYVRNVRCAGLSVVHIQKKNKISVWIWVEVGLDKLKDTGSRENHGCDGLTASRKLPAYDWKT
jgi:hypothetical protein